MAQFIITDIIMLSLGAMLYLAVRALPRIEEDTAATRGHTLVDRLLHSEIPHKIDAVVNSYSGKFFRKLKVLLMKFDNYLTHRIKKMNTHMNGTGKPKIDFKDVTGENADAANEKKE